MDLLSVGRHRFVRHHLSARYQTAAVTATPVPVRHQTGHFGCFCHQTGHLEVGVIKLVISGVFVIKLDISPPKKTHPVYKVETSPHYYYF